MAKIENVTNWEHAREAILAMDAPSLIAQHLIQRGAADALECALKLGANADVIRTMLANVRTGQDLVAATAAMRGIDLISEE